MDLPCRAFNSVHGRSTLGVIPTAADGPFRCARRCRVVSRSAMRKSPSAAWDGRAFDQASGREPAIGPAVPTTVRPSSRLARAVPVRRPGLKSRCARSGAWSRSPGKRAPAIKPLQAGINSPPMQVHRAVAWRIDRVLRGEAERLVGTPDRAIRAGGGPSSASSSQRPSGSTCTSSPGVIAQHHRHCRCRRRSCGPGDVPARHPTAGWMVSPRDPHQRAGIHPASGNKHCWASAWARPRPGAGSTGRHWCSSDDGRQATRCG